MAAFVLLAAVAGTLGVAADLALVGLHRALLIAESTGAGRWVIAVPIGPSSHDFPDRLGRHRVRHSPYHYPTTPATPTQPTRAIFATIPSKPGCAG